MRRPLTLCALLLALAACAGGPGARGPGGRGGGRMAEHAQPTDVIGTELAFARAAQEKGQWTAFAEFAADDAVMFVPEPVGAKEWLKRQQNPPAAVRWQPHEVWSSCDGSLAVTRGGWQRPDGSVGYFTTVWRRQRNGEYRWLIDQGDTLAEPLAAPEMIAGKVADCGPAADGPPSASVDDGGNSAAQQRVMRARDGSLVATWDPLEGGGRTFRVSLRLDGRMQDVLSLTATGG